MRPLSELSLQELWELFPIILREHNRNYAQWYLQQAQQLLGGMAAAGIAVFRISHIGSTAVPGLMAKPIVDILLELENPEDTEGLDTVLTNAGFLCMSASARPYWRRSYNKGYTPSGFAERVFHLHVRHAGDWGELYFRDYLLEHGDCCREYEALKIGLLPQFEHDRDGYTKAKTQFVERYTHLARLLYAGRYQPGRCVEENEEKDRANG